MANKSIKFAQLRNYVIPEEKLEHLAEIYPSVTIKEVKKERTTALDKEHETMKANGYSYRFSHNSVYYSKGIQSIYNTVS